jgi:hypothetical protein
MGNLYAKPLSRDQGGEPLQEYPAPYKAKTQYTGENGTASSVISLTADTTTIEISAIGGTGAAMRWVPRTETAAVSPFASVITVAGATANYDHVVPAGEVRRFVVPIETLGAQQGSVVGINPQNGLYQRVAVKTFGVSSVMTSEF